MNAVLEALIAKINQDEFSDKEIVVISQDDVFDDDDLQKLEQAVNSNEWVKNNLAIVQLHPNSFSRSFYVSNLKHSINVVSIRTKEKLADVIQELESGTFHYSSVAIFYHSDTNDTKFSDDDLDALVAAINASEWCQNYLKKLDIRIHATRLPALKCQNLQELNISINPLSKIAELDCPNLLHVNAMSIGKFDINAFNKCHKLKQIDAFSSNLRVPPNIMPYPNLKELYVQFNSPFSPLGVFALLLMQQVKQFRIDPGQSDLASNFAIAYQNDPDFRMPELFADHSWGNPKLADDIANDFIDKFEIPEHFLEDQINRILSFMSKIYNHGTPAKVSRSGESTFYPDAAQKELNHTYQSTRSLLLSTIDGLLERDSITPTVNPNDILNAAKEKIDDSLATLDAHNHFFLAELNSDFATLTAIFNAVGKPQHAQTISSYVEKNSSRWPQLLDPKHVLYLDAKSHIKDVLAKKLSNIESSSRSRAASPVLETKRLKEDEPMTKQSEKSGFRCVIS